jgi:CRP-like cAMP-binding protein
VVKKSGGSAKPAGQSSASQNAAVRNHILVDLPAKELDKVFPSLVLVRLKLHQFLHEAGDIIKSVYFLDDGLGSVLCVQPDGKSVEVGLIGKEGFVGTPVIFGLQSSALRVVVQTDGTAHRLDVGTLRNILPQCPEMTRRMQLFSTILAMQSTQIAACNRLHEVEERLARWLLMSHDRVGLNTMPLTQEFLGQMLGTRRSSVSMAASSLQKAGMITYTRGHVTIVNRKRLLEAACDCYPIIQHQEQTWKAESHQSS